MSADSNWRDGLSELRGEGGTSKEHLLRVLHQRLSPAFASSTVRVQALLPSLRVLARSSPEDKLTLVKMLKAQVRGARGQGQGGGVWG